MITRVACFTRDRPTELARCLEELVVELGRWGRSVELTVFDDRRGSGDDVRRYLAGLAARWAEPLRYAGAAEKAAFAAKLVEEGRGAISVEAADFALFGVRAAPTTIGANRNAHLLDAAGALSIVVDDDVIPRVARVPGASEGICLAEAVDVAAWWFERRAAALASAAFDEVDLVGLHEATLGQLTAGDAPARVLVTSFGLVGDGGMASPHERLLLHGASRARLVDDADRYTALRVTRELLQAVTTTTITAAPALMLPFAGLDLRGELPPFVPLLRNEDGLFAAMLARSRPDGRIAHLPWAVLHAPEPPRPPFPADVFASARVPLAWHLIDAILLVAPLATRGAHAWTARLGAELGRLSRSPASVLGAFVDGLLRERRRQQAARFAAALDAHDRLPAAWARDLEATIASFQAEIARPGLMSPGDLGFFDADPAAATRVFLARLGGMFETWPAMVTAARALRARGVRLSVEIGLSG